MNRGSLPEASDDLDVAADHVRPFLDAHEPESAAASAERLLGNSEEAHSDVGMEGVELTARRESHFHRMALFDFDAVRLESRRRAD